MKTQLADFIKGTAAGAEAEGIVRACVHCGFCTATCPTYQLLGDELDGPRGRIYLIKQMLEGSAATASTRLHLDRCLVCRNCETSCPSGVQFGRLLDIGRSIAITQAPRTRRSRLARRALAGFLTGPLFAPTLRIAQALRPLLPAALRARIPRRLRAGAWPGRPHARRMLLLAGCVQPALSPDINAATARVFDRLGIELVVATGVACCGALPHHLDDPAGALALARRNIDGWWPHIEAGAEALVSNASGCGAMVQEYGHLLRHDAAYAARAARISALAVDVVQVVAQLAAQWPARPLPATAPRVAFHPPCTLQHAQKIRGGVEALLRALGAEVVPFADSHLCCGSAGSYSLLQPGLATQLRGRKLDAIMSGGPQLILSANVGCITHLAAAAPVPVQHWIEWLDARLA